MKTSGSMMHNLVDPLTIQKEENHKLHPGIKVVGYHKQFQLLLHIVIDLEKSVHSAHLKNHQTVRFVLLFFFFKKKDLLSTKSLYPVCYSETDCLAIWKWPENKFLMLPNISPVYQHPFLWWSKKARRLVRRCRSDIGMEDPLQWPFSVCKKMKNSDWILPNTVPGLGSYLSVQTMKKLMTEVP